MSLVYRGSVKDIYQDGKNLKFVYSDRYSIYDWGEMPDHIPHKGEALAFMAAAFFEHLKTKNILSHYIGSAEKNSILVKPVEVIRPGWTDGKYNYGVYDNRPTECLVPLEIIFRYRLGLGNSLEKRLKNNPAYLADLNLEDVPNAMTEFNPALVEFSTKLETTDRYLNQKELTEMQVLSKTEQVYIKQFTQDVAAELKSLFYKCGIDLWDGKVEYGFGQKKSNGERELFLVDSIGPDELRLTVDGLPLSKEFLRQMYARSSWADNVSKAKAIAASRGQQDWKKICKDELHSVPERLSEDQLELASDLYLSLANTLAKALRKPLPFAENKNLENWSDRVRRTLKAVGVSL